MSQITKGYHFLHYLSSPLKYFDSNYLPIVRSYTARGGVAQWVARLTRNVEVVGSSPIKGPRCFLEQETLPLLLSTGRFKERIRA